MFVIFKKAHKITKFISYMQILFNNYAFFLAFGI